MQRGFVGRPQGLSPFNYYDSLILATALSVGCETIATEDMQHGQVIEDVLTIRNPFGK